MECRDVTQRLQPFLDDLLQEDDYQAIHGHLTSCVTCREHIGAVGSLGYAVKTLGQVEVPSDLGATILFRLKQQPREAESPSAPRSGRPVIVGTVLAALVGGGVVLGVVSLRGRDDSPQQPAQPVVTAPENRTLAPPSDAEAQQLLLSLQTIAASIGAETPEPPAEIPAPPSEPAPAESPEPIRLDWVVRFTLPNQAELMELIERRAIFVDRKSDQQLLLLIPGSDVITFVEQVKAISGVETDLIDPDLTQYVAEDSIQVMLHLSEQYLSR